MRLIWSLALAFALVSPVQAQEAAPAASLATPVLTLDKQRLFSESEAGRAIETQITAENDALAAENRKIDAALEAEERDLTARRPSLSAEEFQALAEAFNTKAVGLREAQESKAKALERKREELRQNFFKSLGPILGEIMAELGAFVILDDQAVLVSFDRIDITDEAIARMNALGLANTPPTAP
jgi:Skp family chaperone for outer membrane proteins